MKLRLFTGKDTAAAIAAARAALGPEALVLEQRRVKGGVEIAAAVERAEEEAPPVPDLLARHGVAEPLARALAASPLALPARLRFGAVPEGPVMLVGPPGAGKTLAAIRLATAALLAGRSPRVTSADARRAGGELLSLLAVLGLAPHAEAASADIVDTAGIDVFDAASAAETARAWRGWGCTHLVATRLDLSPRLGSLLAAADAGLVLALASLSPATGAAMVPLTPAFLARRLASAPTRRHLDA